MKTTIFAGAVALIVVACGGDDSSDTNASGGKGGTSGGSGGASGGAGGATGGAGGTSGGSGGTTGGTGGASGGSAGSGTGGAAGSPNDGGAGTAGSGGDAAACADLLKKFQEALTAAAACSPQLGVVQCNGTATVPDQCACPVVLNETQPSKVKAAQDAYDAWVKAGCGPFGCGKACFDGTKGTCSASGVCQWSS